MNKSKRDYIIQKLKNFIEQKYNDKGTERLKTYEILTEPIKAEIDYYIEQTEMFVENLKHLKNHELKNFEINKEAKDFRDKIINLVEKYKVNI